MFYCQTCPTITASRKHEFGGNYTPMKEAVTPRGDERKTADDRPVHR